MTNRTGILAQSPLTYALASIRFASWPMMVKRIEEIHDQLRDKTPLINRIQISQVTAGQAGVTQSEDSSHNAWMLMSPDRLEGVQFAPDQILVFSRKYTRYSEFEKLLDKTLKILLQEMRFIDLTGLGVRYVDHIRAQKDETLDLYLNPRMLQPSFPELDEIGGSMFAAYMTKECELRVRVIAQPEALNIPDDLIGLLAMTQEPGKPLKLDLLGEGAMLLDIDAIKGHKNPVRLESCEPILSQLKTLHNEANSFFRNTSVCTDHAFDIWSGK